MFMGAEQLLNDVAVSEAIGVYFCHGMGQTKDQQLDIGCIGKSFNAYNCCEC